jgi:2-polyprenyl-3-methyl-5-hydroxy-6-metoxy-1,4-benzoquinol methylase
MNKSRKCPVCNSHEYEKIEKINFLLFEEHPISKGYDLVQCKICSFIYADVKVSQIELDHYYSNISKYEDKQISTGGGYNIYDKERLAGVAIYLSNLFTDKNIKIADVGCAIGGLLEQLKKLGFDNITGIDPSKSCVEITKNEKGIDCLHSSLFDLNDSFGTYDLIIISHVWEHILDLETAINSLEKILSPNGYIYIECPNAMNYKNTIHAPLQELNTEHINHFYEKGFLNFFGLRNYKCIDIGNKIVKIASGEDYDALYGVFQKSSTNLDYKIQFDYDILASLQEYINKSRIWFDKIIHIIESNLSNERNVAIYGIGQFAFKLLYEIVKKRPDLNLFLFDNNSLNVGKEISKFKINKGADLDKYLGNEKLKIIITSLIHQNSIKQNINNILTEKNITQVEIIELK